MAAQGLEAGLDQIAAASDHLRGKSHPGPVIGCVEAVRIGDENLAAGFAVGALELDHLRPLRPSALVELAQQLRLALRRDPLGAGLDGLRLDGGGAQRRRLGAAAAQGGGRRIGGALEVARPQSVDMGEVGGAVLDHANPGPLLAAALHALDPRLVDRHRQPPAALRVELGELAAVGQGPGDDRAGQFLGDQFAHLVCRLGLPAMPISSAAAAKSSPPAPLSAAKSVPPPSAAYTRANGRRVTRRRRMKAPASSA